VSELNALYAAYKSHVRFYVIYIREAHAADSRRPDRQVELYEPVTFKEREEAATSCQSDLGLKLPMLIDDLKNSTDAKYSGWPDRLFLVGQDGTIAYRGGRGPRGFKPAELKAAIAKTLGGAAEAGPTSQPSARSKEDLEAIKERLRRQRKASLDKAKEPK
jgi:hypothetical protein